MVICDVVTEDECSCRRRRSNLQCQPNCQLGHHHNHSHSQLGHHRDLSSSSSVVPACATLGITHIATYDGSPRVYRCAGFMHKASGSPREYRCAGFMHKASGSPREYRCAGFSFIPRPDHGGKHTSAGSHLDLGQHSSGRPEPPVPASGARSSDDEVTFGQNLLFRPGGG